jgi:hypothetical protein
VASDGVPLETISANLKPSFAKVSRASWNGTPEGGPPEYQAFACGPWPDT